MPGVDHINRTGGVVAGALPLLYGMAEGIVDRRDAARAAARGPGAGPARLGHPPLPAARRGRLHAGPLKGRVIRTEAAYGTQSAAFVRDDAVSFLAFDLGRDADRGRGG